MKKVVLMGAGGKMGCRITTKLKNHPDYQVTYVEVSNAGIARLKDLGVSVTPQDKALADAEIVILAIPDVLISKVSQAIVPQLKSGAIVIGLDPAAAYAGVMPERKDITYFVDHPCHPPIFHDETDPKAMVDWFGGTAKQDVVCALFQGPEKDYAIGEALVRIMFGPILNIFRITIEQMAILEPALVESFNAVLVDAMKEAMEEAIKMGVPREAAYGFLMGHVRVQFAVIFGLAGFEFSDGAKLALKQAKELIFKPDWKEKIMNLQAIKHSVAEITATVKK
jgi:D-apionate oxidoisomerase